MLPCLAMYSTTCFFYISLNSFYDKMSPLRKYFASGKFIAPKTQLRIAFPLQIGINSLELISIFIIAQIVTDSYENK